MLAKTTGPGGLDWDDRLPYVLLAYRCSVQESTGESPFFMLYGRDPQLPPEEALSKPVDRCYLDADDYKSELVRNLSEAWERAQRNVKKAQKNRSSTTSEYICQSLLWETVCLCTNLVLRLARPINLLSHFVVHTEF